MESTSTSSAADTKLPALLAFGLATAGLILGLILGGLTGGSIIGAIVASFGIAPALYGMWKGLQQTTQVSLLLSVVGLLYAIAITALMIILRVVSAVV